MKKTVIGLAASSALVLGAGAFGSSAVAAPSAYPSTVNTLAAITRSASVTEGRTFYVATIVVGGNSVVNDGTVTFVFGGVKTTATVRNGTASARIKAPKVSRTTYKTINGYYKPTAGSIFTPSKASSTLLVKNRKKK